MSSIMVYEEQTGSQVADKLLEAMSLLRGKVMELERKAACDMSPAMKVEDAYAPLRNVSLDYSEPMFSSQGNRPALLERNRKLVADKYAECEAIHARNAEALEHNKQIHAKIAAMMRMVGVADKWRERTHTNPRTRRHVRESVAVDHSAGYFDDLRRCVIIEDGFSWCLGRKDDLLKEVDAKAKRWDEEAKAKELAEKSTEGHRLRCKLLESVNVVLGFSHTTLQDAWKGMLENPSKFQTREDLWVQTLANKESRGASYVLVGTELEHLNQNGYDIEPDGFRQLSDTLSGEWKYGAEHDVVVESLLTGKRYITTYRRDNNGMFTEYPDNLEWKEAL